eukprot:sb/3466446/
MGIGSGYCSDRVNYDYSSHNITTFFPVKYHFSMFQFRRCCTYRYYGHDHEINNKGAGYFIHRVQEGIIEECNQEPLIKQPESCLLCVRLCFGLANVKGGLEHINCRQTDNIPPFLHRWRGLQLDLIPHLDPSIPSKQEPTETSRQPIRTRYLGHVTGYQPIRGQYFLNWSRQLIHLHVFKNVYLSNLNSLFRSRDWLSANQGPVFPDSVGSCLSLYYYLTEFKESRDTTVVTLDDVKHSILTLETHQQDLVNLCSQYDGNLRPDAASLLKLNVFYEAPPSQVPSLRVMCVHMLLHADDLNIRQIEESARAEGQLIVDGSDVRQITPSHLDIEKIEREIK